MKSGIDVANRSELSFPVSCPDRVSADDFVKGATNTGDEIIESAVVGARIGGLVSGLSGFDENAFRGKG